MCTNLSRDPVPPTPEKPDPSLPNDFNQSTATIRQMTLTVEVNDEFNGQYDYQVWVYDVNPFYADDAKPLYGGVANGNKPYVRTMTLPQALETIYIMQIDPQKRKIGEDRISRSLNEGSGLRF